LPHVDGTVVTCSLWGGEEGVSIFDEIGGGKHKLPFCSDQSGPLPLRVPRRELFYNEFNPSVYSGIITFSSLELPKKQFLVHDRCDHGL